MDLRDLFRAVPVVAAPELKGELEQAGPDDVVLLDVREPAEYESGHLPGARHIPLSRLADRLGEIDRSKPVVTY